jgi:hypothetical protein
MKKWDFEQPVWVNILSWVIGIVLVCGLVFGLLCLNGWLVMLLWNSTLPTAIVGFQSITFWQAVGIDILITLLFGGFTKIMKIFKNKDDD